MIFGIGTDIVRIDRIQKSLDRFGDRFAEKILAESELIEYRDVKRQARFIAKRFAAKEAVTKAMGTGFSHGLGPKDVAVTHDQHGKPAFVYSSSALKIATDLGIGKGYLSISDERDYATAFAVLTRG